MKNRWEGFFFNLQIVYNLTPFTYGHSVALACHINVVRLLMESTDSLDVNTDGHRNSSFQEKAQLDRALPSKKAADSILAIAGNFPNLHVAQ